MKRYLLMAVALLLVASLTGCASTPNAGQIGVVREGKSVAFWTWTHGHNIKKVIPPGKGFTYTGLGTSVHYYPDDEVQRNYTITSESGQGDKKGADVVEVPTSDGVRVGLEGTFYFKTAFNGTKQGEELVKDFDNRFGIRTFKENNEGESVYPYQGENGWKAFLSQVIRPIINNDLRRSVATVTCAQLVSSCALVHNSGTQPVSAVPQTSNQNIEKVQKDINENLKSDIETTLGKGYFSSISFLLERATMPDAIQEQIDKAQAQFAAVGSAQAKVLQSKLEAEANERREAGYSKCPACAAIDELKSIPSSVHTFAPGAGFAITH